MIRGLLRMLIHRRSKQEAFIFFTLLSMLGETPFLSLDILGGFLSPFGGLCFMVPGQALCLPSQCGATRFLAPFVLALGLGPVLGQLNKPFHDP